MLIIWFDKFISAIANNFKCFNFVKVANILIFLFNLENLTFNLFWMREVGIFIIIQF